MYTASCHCGNISLSVEKLPTQITTCNCSICRRLGALWAYYLPDEVEITHSQDAGKSYCWGDKEIEFHHCSLCGCATHYTTLPGLDAPKTAINCRMMDLQLIEGIALRKFDGAETWTTIDESQKYKF